MLLYVTLSYIPVRLSGGILSAAVTMVVGAGIESPVPFNVSISCLALQAHTPENVRLATTTSVSKTCKGLGSRSMGHIVLRRTAVQPYVHEIPYCTTRCFSIDNGLCSWETSS
jgi:hypothetical protein